jgi:excisionase family DNA binding protein
MAVSARLVPRGSGSPVSARLGEILTIDDVATYLKIPKKTVYKMTRSGELRAFKAGKHWRVPQSELDAWILKQLPKPDGVAT